MKIVVTGNPNYEGLCKGIYEAYNSNFVEFIGRYNGWDLTDFDKVAEYGDPMYLLIVHMVLMVSR